MGGQIAILVKSLETMQVYATKSMSHTLTEYEMLYYESSCRLMRTYSDVLRAQLLEEDEPDEGSSD
jgi:hypothetical protein